MKNTTRYEADTIPPEMKEYHHWVCWKGQLKDNGKMTKIPLDPKTGRYAKANDPSTWGSFAQAIAFAEKHPIAGIGFVFSEEDPFVGIDLDNCWNKETEDWQPWAYAIMERLDSYTEKSPSGNGVHIILAGKLPGPGIKKGSIEMYDRARFFTVTGHTVSSDKNTVRESQSEITDFYRKITEGDPPRNPGAEAATPNPDTVIKDAVSEYATRFDRLMAGNWRNFGSQSEADLALCQMLISRTDGSPAVIDRLFRESGLYRDKWDKAAAAGGQTYGQLTIEKALNSSFTKPTAETKKNQTDNTLFNLTDLGNSERLVRMFGDDIRYCHQLKTWFIWNGTCWEEDSTRKIFSLAKKVVRNIYNEAAWANDSGERKEIARHAKNSESESRIKSMIKLAEGEQSVSIKPDQLDQNPWLLTCLNGTVDLWTGKMLPHNRKHFITKTAPVEYDPFAECPTWNAFLDRIMDRNDNLISFLQRSIGYALTGDTSEQCMFILYGSGANGKSTFLQAINTMLGAHSMQTPTETLLVKRGGSIPNDVARLKGSRLVIASEAETNQRLAEGLIKQMTGQDTISARFLHQEWFDFLPTHKIYLATNHKPVISGTDPAIWRRIRLIPFEVTIPEHDRDKKLLAKLEGELSGILSWAIRGCLDWTQNGLGEPVEVRAATNDYKCEMDVIAQFINDCCTVEQGCSATARDLYDAYVAWCEETGDDPLSQRAFGMKLKEKGFSSFRTQEGRCWRGLEMVSMTHDGHMTHHDACLQV